MVENTSTFLRPAAHRPPQEDREYENTSSSCSATNGAEGTDLFKMVAAGPALVLLFPFRPRARWSRTHPNAWGDPRLATWAYGPNVGQCR